MEGPPGRNTDLSLGPPSPVVCSTAVTLEREIVVKLQPSFTSLNSWSSILEEVYAGLQPDDKDVRVRNHLIQVVDNLVKSQLPGSSVSAFGSYAMNLFSPSSDLDLSLSSSSQHQENSKEYKVHVLKKLRRVLERPGQGFMRVEAITRATVPLIKFRDCQSGIECDLSVNNEDAVIKSDFLGLVCLMDSRYRKLCYLVKAWAKAQGINDSKTGTVNSVSWILLVAFHLQTRSPPILPPFSELLEGVNLSKGARSLNEVRNRVEKLKKDKFGLNNVETTAQLFATFFLKLIAVRSLWEKGLCASTYAGRWTFKLWKTNYAIAVEDFGDFTNNVARAVFRSEIVKIYHALQNAVDLLSASSHDVKSTVVSLFGDSKKKRPPQELLSGPYDKRQKVTETRFRANYVQGGQGESSRSRQELSWRSSQGDYGRANHTPLKREWPPDETHSVWYGSHPRPLQVPHFQAPFVFPQNYAPALQNMVQQSPDAAVQSRFPQNPYPQYNPNFDSQVRRRRNGW